MSDYEDRWNAIRDDVQRTLTAKFAEHGLMLQDFVLISTAFDTADPDPDVGMSTMVAKGQRLWQTLGLVEYMRVTHQSGVIVREMGDD